MKRLFVSAAVLLVAAGCMQNQVPETGLPVYITDSSCQAELSYAEMISRLSESDAVFVGEIHTDSLTHRLEMEILEDLFARSADIAVSMEMFERDVQEYVDQYLAGSIDEEVFLSKTRPWNNYATAYRPLVEFAKEHRFPVIAMNVPRRYAAVVARSGIQGLEALNPDEKKWIAKEVKPLNDEYRKRFVSLMTGRHKPGPMAMMTPQKMYEAQCLKDDTMAESIDSFLDEHSSTRIVSYQGAFHSDFRLGIVKKLLMLRPDLNITVVSVVPVEDPETVDRAEHAGRGDIIVFVKGG